MISFLFILFVWFSFLSLFYVAGFCKSDDAVLFGEMVYHFFNFFPDAAIIILQVFHSQPTPTTLAAAPHPPTMRPRVRARRGQATDPHSIAERVSLM